MKHKFVNIHIPKTAGSTFRHHLSRSLGLATQHQTRVIGIDGPTPDMDHFLGMRDAFGKRFPKINQDGMQVVTGHYRYRDIADLLAPIRSEITLVTFVRDPIWRTLSDYFYSISERHKGRQAFLATYPTFEDYMEVPGQMNKQNDFLCPRDDASVAETIQSVLEGFDFIGLTEQFDDDYALLMGRAGLPYEKLAAENINPDRQKMHAAYDRYKDQLGEILHDEYALYDAIRHHRQSAHQGQP